MGISHFHAAHVRYDLASTNEQRKNNKEKKNCKRKTCKYAIDLL